MSRLGNISLKWADGEHNFALLYDQMIELQEKCDAGPFVILARLQTGQWRIQDVRETVRLGLIGGGTKASEALVLTDRYIKAPWQEHVPLAAAILGAAVMGVEEETLGKKKRPRKRGEKAMHSQTENSGSQISTAPAS